MYRKFFANFPIESDYEVVRHGVEAGLQGRVSAYDKETYVMDGLAISGPLNLGGDPAPTDDGPFDCVNKPKYDCEEQVFAAGSRCSLCISLDRRMREGLALYRVDFYTHYRSESHFRDTEYPVDDGPFDCVNKPQYNCPERVNRAGGKCSLCRDLKRGYKEDEVYDEGDPHDNRIRPTNE